MQAVLAEPAIYFPIELSLYISSGKIQFWFRSWLGSINSSGAPLFALM